MLCVVLLSTTCLYALPLAVAKIPHATPELYKPNTRLQVLPLPSPYLLANTDAS